MKDGEKDFDGWNELKKFLHTSKSSGVPFKEGDIWWCSLGLNIGREQDGKNALFERPALILVKFNDEMALAAPLTSVVKQTRYHFPLDIGFAILSQTRLVSVKRFQRYIKTVSESELGKVKKQYIRIVQMSR